MLKSNRHTAWTEDRFMVFLVLATALHVLIFFGVGFGITLNPVPRLADTLDVVLVQWRSEEEPDEASPIPAPEQRPLWEPLPDPEADEDAGRRLALDEVEPDREQEREESGDEERVPLVLEVLEDRARVLPHQDGVGGIVVDPELVAELEAREKFYRPNQLNSFEALARRVAGSGDEYCLGHS